MALPEAQKVVASVALATIAGIWKDQKLVAAIMAEAQKKYKEHLREAVVALAVERAKNDAQKIVNELGPVVFAPVPGELGELCDPATGSQSETSEALLARLVQEFVSREEIACGAGTFEGSDSGPCGSQR